MLVTQSRHSFFYNSIVMLAIICITLALKVLVLDKHFPKEIVYTNTALSHNQISNIRIKSYALKDSYHRFLFATLAPKELELGIKFGSNAKVTALIRGEYNSDTCRNNGGHNRAIVNIQGSKFKNSFTLLDGQATELNLLLKESEILEISISNDQNPKCGRARITFLEHQNPSTALLYFISIWLLLFIICFLLGVKTLVSAFGAVFHFLLLLADASLGELSFPTFWVNTNAALCLSAALLIFSTAATRSILSSIVLTLLVLFCLTYPLLFIGHLSLFSSPVVEDSIHAVLQSYIPQAIEFWQNFIEVKFTIVFIVGVFTLYLLTRSIINPLPRKRTAIIVGLTVLVINSYFLFSSLRYSHSISLIDSAITKYHDEINVFQEMAEQRKSSPVVANQDPSFRNNLSIFIIGESVNKNHMSAYGYPRNTTPNIDKRVEKNEVIRFSSIYSNHTHSNPTLTHMLTSANQYNGKYWLNTASIFNIAQSVNLESTWISNHRMLGRWSNKITVIAKEADNVTTINKKVGPGNAAANYDGKMLPLLYDSITSNPNQLMFFHLYNSHWDYCNRYPNSAKKFDQKDISRAHFGQLSVHRKTNAKTLNCYDNTIFYTDQLLEEIIVNLEGQPQPTLLFYISDHADDVFNAKGHNQAVYTYEMSDVPLFIWANQAWREKHEPIWNTLEKNKDNIFTNDYMFDTVLGLVGINSPEIEQKNDLSSNSYQPPITPTTLHGRKNLDSPENRAFWQRKNAVKAKYNEIHLGALNIDSIGKANYAINLGFSTLQVHVIYSENDRLVVTNANYEPIDISLRQFLAESNISLVDKVFLQFENNHNYDINTIQESLTTLSKTFSIDISLMDIENKHFARTPLASPDFIKEINPSDFDKSKVIMTELITVYD